MKKLFLLLLLFTNLIFSQTTIFSENMGIPTANTLITTYTGGTSPATFQNVASLTYTGTGTTDVRLSTPSLIYTGASGNGNVFITNSTTNSFQISGINTSGFSSLSLSFGHFKNTTASNNELIVEVSSDGTTYTPLTYTRATGTGTAIWTLVTPTGTIPSTNNLRIRFRQTSTTTQFRIDDIVLKGTPSCTPPTISSISPTSGPVGTQVTITASSGSLLNATAKFGVINATVLSSSATQLVILIPSGATSGAISITDSQPCSTTTSAFTVTILTPQCGYLTDLFMSQVTDASSGGLSYIELYNGTGAPINLGNYSLKTASNGLAYSATLTLNNVILPNNSTYTLSLGSNVASGNDCTLIAGGDGSMANQIGPSTRGINFTVGGNDHFGLFNGTTLIDSFGTFGSATWADPLGIGVKGVDFKRRNNATLPNTSFNNSDWVITDWADLPTCSNDEYSDIGLYTFTPPNSTTWNGLNWSNGTPTLSKLAIINGNYNTTTNGDIEACSLIVNSTFLLEITDSRFVKIQNDLTIFGTLNVLNNGSLIQINDNGINTGNITYNRDVNSLKGYDYIYWSSPVSSQTMESIYSTPSMGFKYFWNTLLTNSNGNGGNISQGNWSVASGNMTPGIGYIIRASSSFGWTGNLTATFTNKPNNGIITTPIYRGNYTGVDYSGLNGTIITNLSDNYNLIGNPYPSAINSLEFLSNNNNIQGFVYLWTHGTAPSNTITSPFYSTFQYNYTSNDYITHNGTATTNGPSGFNGDIASGQGFFVVMNDGTTTTQSVIFKNSMRNSNNSQFYRIQNQKSRIWIDLVDSNFQSNRMVIGYVDDATNNRDRLYDAITTTNNKIYSIINNEPFIIQGRSLPFKKNDEVKIGINITITGEYKIAIAEVDGLFNNQDIYLEDKLLNITHDLKLSPYTFTSNVGVFNNRFILKYKTNNGNHYGNLKVKYDNNTIIYNKDNKINIDSNKIIKNVKVYDITGKLLYDNNFNSNNIKFSLECSKQILIVKIKTDDDEIITKKVSN